MSDMLTTQMTPFIGPNSGYGNGKAGGSPLMGLLGLLGGGLGGIQGGAFDPSAGITGGPQQNPITGAWTQPGGDVAGGMAEALGGVQQPNSPVSPAIPGGGMGNPTPNPAPQQPANPATQPPAPPAGPPQAPPQNPAQGGNPLQPQPQGPPQGSYQQGPSAFQDSLTGLFNASSGIDTGQLDSTLSAIQNQATRTASSQAANTASAALGRGGAGTPVAALANQAVGDVLAQSEAAQNQATLEFLLGRSGQNIQGLNAAAGLALNAENQAFNQGLAGMQQQMQNLGLLMDAGSLPRELEQQHMTNMMAEFLRLQGADTQVINQIIALMGGTPVMQPTPVIPNPVGDALGGALAGAELVNATQTPNPTPTPPAGHNPTGAY